MFELDGPDLVSLVRAIALDPRHAKLRWQAVSLVVERSPSSSAISGVDGFVYLDDGTWQLAQTEVDDVAEIYAELIASGQCREDWVRCLFQVVRPSGASRFYFEPEDPDRWQIVPPGSDAQAEAIRPDFV